MLFFLFIRPCTGIEVLIITHNVIIFIAADIYEQEPTAGEFLNTHYFEEKYT